MPNPMLVGKLKRDAAGNSYHCYNSSSQHVINEYHKKVGDEKNVRSSLGGLTEEKLRSVEQNNYYWGVVLELLAKDSGYIGPGEKEDLHNKLRSKFLVYIDKDGDAVVQSTTKVSTKIFELYLEAVRQFAMDFYQCFIPLPNEVETPDESKTYRKL